MCSNQRLNALVKECIYLLRASADVKLGISELDELIHCHAEFRVSSDPLEEIVGLAFILNNGTSLSS